MLHEFMGIGVFLLVAILFGIGSLTAAWLVQTQRPNPIKLDTFECGLDTEGKTWVKFRSQYLIYGLLFVAFDVETVFLYPWAVVVKKVGVLALVEIIIFFFILFLGFLYAHKKGALKWS